jgi:anti-sigma B factor antagonist
MNISTESLNNTKVVRFGPRLDSTNAAQLEVALSDAIGSERSVVLDLSELEYISSAGLRVVLSIAKAANARSGRVTLSNAQEAVREVLVITGFDTMLGLHASATDAAAALA